MRMNASQIQQARFSFSPRRTADSYGDPRPPRRPSPDARHGIDFYRECECAWRAGGEHPPLGIGRTADVRIAHRRVSLLGPGSLLPLLAKRGLCDRCGVSRAERAMGSLIPKIA